MRRLLTIGLALSLIAAACGDDDGAAATSTPPPSTAGPVSSTSTTAAPTTTSAPATVPPGFTATSDDGRVTLDVPAGMLAADPGIEITALDAADHPEEMAALDPAPWVYRLEPGALTFDAPVRVTVEIPFAEFATDGFEDAVPLATLVTTVSDGDGWEPLGDQVIRRDGDSVLISGTTDHFSRLGVVPEQVFIETRFIELSTDEIATLGVDFRWSNGVVLEPPALGSAEFLPTGSDPDPISVGLEPGGLSIACPPAIAALSGDLKLEMLLSAVEDAGQTGIVSAPRVLGPGATVQPVFQIGIRLECRPTISADGSVQLDIAVDHPGGEVIIPGGDFRGGLSGMFIELARAFPGLFVGLIRDLDGDGMLDADDLMYPPFPAVVDGDTTSVVLPLFGYGDYFPYFLDGGSGGLETQVMVGDGASFLLGGLQREQTAVPLLGDIPFLARVFSDESRQSEDVELVILVTPQITEGAE